MAGHVLGESGARTLSDASGLAWQSLACDVVELEADASVLVQALRVERELRAVALSLYADALRALKVEKATSAHLREELRALLAQRRAA